MDKIFVVIPTIRDVEMLTAWKNQFKNCHIMVVEDHKKKSVRIPSVGKKRYHYSWQDIDQDLGENSWIIPRRVSAIRNYGFLKAYQMGAKMIITMDDDCYPVDNHKLVQKHQRNLGLSVPAQWVNTYPDARFMYTRGMPYLNRDKQPVMLSHGLWTNVLDLDAPTHLQHLDFRADYSEHFLQIFPQGSYYPMCSMNLAFNSKITPLMYFPLMGENTEGDKWGYDRFDDIWAGIFSKKVMDHLGFSVINGAPFVRHDKASNIFSNLKKEAKGIEKNELIWQKTTEVELTKQNPVSAYQELIEKIELPEEEYFRRLKQAIKIWLQLFD
jgi:reversibly glycosylated polypeptide/UDP-arabinopyranose mutase